MIYALQSSRDEKKIQPKINFVGPTDKRCFKIRSQASAFPNASLMLTHSCSLEMTT